MSAISLTERGGGVAFSEGEWAAGLADAFDILASVGAIGISRVGRYWLVEPRNFVGFARFPGVTVRINSKAGDAFQDIRRMAASAEKVTRAGERLLEAAEQTDTSAHGPFVRALSEVVSVGFPGLYRGRRIVTTRPRGRVVFQDTIGRFASRGIRHMSVCSIADREWDPDLVGVAVTGLGLASDPAELPIQLLELARTLQEVLPHTSPEPIPIALDLIAALETRYAEWPEVRRFLERTRDLLDEERTLWDLQSEIGATEYRFADADRLWELSVLESMRRDLRSRVNYSASFHPYRNTRLPLLSDGGPDLDPDIVIYEGAAPVCVVDAKNSFATAWTAHDVYQVYAYARRLHVSAAVLIYLSRGDEWVARFGSHAGDDVRVIAVGVPVEDVVNGLSRSARHVVRDVLGEPDP